MGFQTYCGLVENEAGHPTGKTVSRDDAFVILQMFPFYLKKIYDLKIFFELNN